MQARCCWWVVRLQFSNSYWLIIIDYHFSFWWFKLTFKPHESALLVVFSAQISEIFSNNPASSCKSRAVKSLEDYFNANTERKRCQNIIKYVVITSVHIKTKCIIKGLSAWRSVVDVGEVLLCYRLVWLWPGLQYVENHQGPVVILFAAVRSGLGLYILIVVSVLNSVAAVCTSLLSSSPNKSRL